MKVDSTSWMRAKADGDAAEVAVAEWFRRRGYLVYKAVGATEPDLHVHTTVEVKQDVAAARSGNIAIEVAYHNRPSGLRKTTAVRWVIVAGDKAYISRVSDLRQFIDRTNHRATSCGDQGRSRCVLIPLAHFRKLRFVHTLNLLGPETSKKQEVTPSGPPKQPLGRTSTQ